MAILPLDQAVPRFQANDDRLNTFVNGGPTTDMVTSGGQSVPSLQKIVSTRQAQIDAFIAAKDTQVNDAVDGLLAQSTTLRDETEGFAAAAEAAKDAAEAAAASVDVVPSGRTISAGTGLEGGGSLAANRTIALSTASQASLANADSALQPAAAAAAYEPIGGATRYESIGLLGGLKTVTDASYTFLDTDVFVEGNRATAQTFTIPAQTTGNFRDRKKIDIVAIGVGQISIAPASGVTLNSKDGKRKLTKAYSVATLYRRGTNDWVLFGDITT